MLKVLPACIRIYQPHDQPGIEEEAAMIRRDAWEYVVRTQPSIIGNNCHLMRSICMLALMISFILLNVSMFDKERDFEGAYFRYIFSHAANGTFLVLWFFCVVTNLCSCGDWSSQLGKLFLHEQIQHFISEISLYPQLCIALIHFWDIHSH